MDSREAKQILAAYRPGDTDSPDPRMALALKLAREDPDLAVWFGQHCAANVKLSAEAEELTRLPSAAEKSSANTADTAAIDHVILLNRPVRVLVAIACLILIGAFLWAHINPAPKNVFDSYRDRMARLVQRTYPMKINAADDSQIRTYFHAAGGAANYQLPKNLARFPDLGAAVFTWHGETVSLLGLDGGANTNLYLFLVKRSTFSNTSTPGKPQFVRVGKVMTASWTLGDMIYMLTGPMDENALKNYTE